MDGDAQLDKSTPFVRIVIVRFSRYKCDVFSSAYRSIILQSWDVDNTTTDTRCMHHKRDIGRSNRFISERHNIQ